MIRHLFRPTSTDSTCAPTTLHQAIELTGMLGSIAHLAYHLGAMRQIAKGMRGPKELQSSGALLT